MSRPTASLEAIGFDASRREEATALGEGLVPARVVRIDRGFATVCTPSGDARTAIPINLDLSVGDFVVLGEHDVIAHVLERRGAVARLVGSRHEVLQVVAANVDVVLVIRPLDLSASPHRIQSMLTLAFDSAATPVVVLTKADLVVDATAQIDAISPIAPGVEIVVTSVVTGEGIDRVRSIVHDRTVVLIGESGGGKSTLTNVLIGSDVLDVAPTRADGQGRHTTSFRELIPLPGSGALIDTPGMREVVAAVTRENVDEGFADITDLGAGCRFRDCSHGVEPGCAVAAALAEGSLTTDRFAAYESAIRDAAWNERRADKAAQAAERKAWRALERQRRVESW